ncbi:dual specificity testis-specific protein kinase 1-like [Amphiura filiformis]|uniref:dual specificity testis-specific protein kinase 1-like n=1 Tax=Amphiura filiformis TaxID=82378 RepID=UPI003B2270EA
MEDEGQLMTSGGRPLSPGASYIFMKNDLSNIARLEDFDQEKIANGFFSEVYKVTHIKTGKVLVLKKNVQQFNRPNVLLEIQLLNQVHHPNIIKFLGVCITDGQLHALTEVST